MWVQIRYLVRLQQRLALTILRLTINGSLPGICASARNLARVWRQRHLHQYCFIHADSHPRGIPCPSPPYRHYRTTLWQEFHLHYRVRCNPDTPGSSLMAGSSETVPVEWHGGLPLSTPPSARVRTAAICRRTGDPQVTYLSFPCPAGSTPTWRKATCTSVVRVRMLFPGHHVREMHVAI